jgi:RES domain
VESRSPANADDLTSYAGPGFCHVPADQPLDIERLAQADEDDDRWNEPGEPTIYLALDLPLALAEYARHAGTDDARDLIRFDVRLDGVADLRPRDGSTDAAGVAEIADRGVARRIASGFRNRPDCRGLLVPSLAFPDDPAHANLVVFADRLPAGIPAWLGRPTKVGHVEVCAEGVATAS